MSKLRPRRRLQPTVEEQAAPRRSRHPQGVPAAGHAQAVQTLRQLQRQVGNQAVARMLGGGYVQRFQFADTDWSATTEVTRSTDGAQGVAFFKDGTDNPLVVKASKDPPRETLFATLFYNKLGKKRNISAPPTRVADGAERGRIVDQLAAKTTDWINEEDKDRTIRAYSEGGQPHVWVMGMARGKTLGRSRKTGESFTKSDFGPGGIVMLMESPDYARRLGFVTACDLFVGQSDRVDVGNLGNWMTDEAGAIQLIDNFSTMSYQGLTERAQKTWETMFAPDLAPSRFKAKGESVYEIIKGMLPPEIQAALEKGFTLGASARKEQFAKYFAKGMADARAKILAKLAPTIGKRSRSLKAMVVAGEGGQEAWNLLKQRVRYMQNLK